jgi:hypothetical protein
MKAQKEMTATDLKHLTKNHTRCCTDLEKLPTMPMVTRYRTKLLSTTYVGLEVVPAESYSKSNAEAYSARDEIPA